jgi:monofunctional glycosyltransferase
VRPYGLSVVTRIFSKIKSDLAEIVTPVVSSFDDLSDLEVLVILLEDRRFFQHRGVDLLSVAREIFKMCTLQRFGGASTIDMQFVRTRTGYKARSLKRKIYEMILAYLLQSRMGKIKILRAYLQEVYLGSGLYGVESASQVMFKKHRYEINSNDAAIIAAMMVYPRPLSPLESWKKKVDRRAAYGLKGTSKNSRLL